MEINFDTAEIHHLLAHLNNNNPEEYDGWYFNQKKHFIKRHKRLIEKLEASISGKEAQ